MSREVFQGLPVKAVFQTIPRHSQQVHLNKDLKGPTVFQINNMLAQVCSDLFKRLFIHCDHFVHYQI